MTTGTGHPATGRPVPDTAVVDIDGTLVDTNYHHALAWFRAFRRFRLTLPVWRIHRAIGMGADKLVGAVAGDRVESEYGDEIRAAHAEEYEPMLAEAVPVEGARELLTEIRRRGFRLVLASSANPHHVERYLDVLDARDLADAWTSAGDVQQTKPAPELIEVAVGKVDGTEPVLVGDSPWDCLAAKQLGAPILAVRIGGFSVAELEEAGAQWVYDSLPDLHRDLDRTPLRSTRA